IQTLNTGVDVDNANNLLVDIIANVSDDLLKQLSKTGALVWYSSARFHSIRAVVPSNQIEAIAAWPDITFIGPKAESITASSLSFSHDPILRHLRPSFAQRAERIRKLLATALQARAAAAATNGTGQGSVTTEGDATHRAFDARTTFLVNGS